MQVMLTQEKMKPALCLLIAPTLPASLWRTVCLFNHTEKHELSGEAQ